MPETTDKLKKEEQKIKQTEQPDYSKVRRSGEPSQTELNTIWTGISNPEENKRLYF